VNKQVIIIKKIHATGILMSIRILLVDADSGPRVYRIFGVWVPFMLSASTSRQTIAKA
jgi:hypothetical protein